MGNFATVPWQEQASSWWNDDESSFIEDNHPNHDYSSVFQLNHSPIVDINKPVIDETIAVLTNLITVHG